jgi:IS6 family transposase
MFQLGVSRISSKRTQTLRQPQTCEKKKGGRILPMGKISREAMRVDKNAASPKAFNTLQAEEHLPANCELRQVKYLNNLIEQDHRFIKRLTKPGMGFFLVETAWRTLQGFEVMNMIRKGQVKNVDKGDILGQVALVSSLFGVAA